MKLLTAEQQEQITKANNEALEEVALRWRNPQTGEPEPDLGKAVAKMLHGYFELPGAGGASSDLYHLISKFQRAKAQGCDDRNSIEPPTEEISNEDQVRLKQLYPDPDPGYWNWDLGEWEWELLMRDAQRDVDCGYVAITPVRDGARFRYHIKPDPTHQEWVITFVLEVLESRLTIHVKGSLQEAKRRLDMLLKADTPPIPAEFPEPTS
jgi:hypothetical protein